MSVNRNILSLAVPSILANVTVPLVGMVDLAIAGHLDASADGVASGATLIGGVAIGTMLFDLLYWNFGFLRIGTGGLTAQACGRGDMAESARIFVRSVGIALACAFVLIALQWLFLQAAFMVVDCTPEVRTLAERYFFIRIWAAPATLCLMAFKGWFIGMQDGVSPMIADLTVNVTNAVLSVALALGADVGGLHYPGIGFAGIAAGTVAAQYLGLLTAASLVFFRYRKQVFGGFSLHALATVFKGGGTGKFFSMNSDLFIRSLCFIGIYIGFTMTAAHYGDLILACGSILMKIMMLFSYFTDGFAYAGEALTGRYIGERNMAGFRKTVRCVFLWSMGIAALFIVLYASAGTPLLGMMTSDNDVVCLGQKYLLWLLVMPLVGCAAFTWDGIYVGATASGSMRNAAILALAGFAATYFICAGLILPAPVPAFSPDSIPSAGGPHGRTVLHILMAAYFVHLLVRTLYLSFRFRSVILPKIGGVAKTAKK